MKVHQVLKYYKELKEFGKRGDRGKPTAASPDTDQTISQANSTRGLSGVRSGPGPKPQAPSDSNSKPQASSDKQQASSSKPQASSAKI